MDLEHIIVHFIGWGRQTTFCATAVGSSHVCIVLAHECIDTGWFSEMHTIECPEVSWPPVFEGTTGQVLVFEHFREGDV